MEQGSWPLPSVSVVLASVSFLAPSFPEAVALFQTADKV